MPHSLPGCQQKLFTKKSYILQVIYLANKSYISQSGHIYIIIYYILQVIYFANKIIYFANTSHIKFTTSHIYFTSQQVIYLKQVIYFKRSIFVQIGTP